MKIKWWHIALLAGGGYLAYKLFKGSSNTGLVGTTIPATGLTTTQAGAVATTDQLNAIAAAAQNKWPSLNNIGVTITDGQIIITAGENVGGKLATFEVLRGTSVQDVTNQIAAAP